MLTTNVKCWLIALDMFMLIWCITAVQGISPDRSAAINCSRYEFYITEMTWDESEEECKSKNGTLICIETKDEWRFIRDEIKNLTEPLAKPKPEWYIGLKKDGDHWKWVNGKVLAWTGIKGQWPWHSGEPSTREPNANCAKMWSNTNRPSHYDNVLCDRNQLSYICEYKRSTEECQDNEKTSSSAAPKTTTGIGSTTIIVTESTAKTQTTRAITTAGDQSTTKQTESSVRTQTTLGSTTGIGLTTKAPKHSTSRLNLKSTAEANILHSTIPSKPVNPTEKQESVDDTKPKEGGFQITYLAIALAVILVVLVCVMVTLYCRKRRNKGKNHDSKDAAIQSPVTADSTTDINEITKGNSSVAFKMVHNNLADSRLTNDKPAHESPASSTFETFSEKTSLKKSSASDSPKDSSQTNINMNDIEAPSTSSPQEDKKEEVVYATVNKAAKTKKGNQEPQVTYADLASFNNCEEAVVNMPPPYQPVEYAEIMGKKMSKKK